VNPFKYNKEEENKKKEGEIKISKIEG